MLLAGTFDKNKIDIPNKYEDDIEVTAAGEILIKYNEKTKIIDMANAIKILGASYISNGFDEIQSISGGAASAGETKLAKIIIEGKSEQTIPTGYTFYDYIESSGTQYIDAGFKPNNNTKVEMKINISTLPTATTCLFGGRDDYSTNNFSAWALVGTQMRWDYASDQLTSGNLVVGDNTIIKDKQTNILNGITISTNISATFQSSYNLTLFGTNTAGTVNYPSAFRLKKCKIWDNGTLIRNMIPAKRNSDNVIGMYDLVNNTFYNNGGTGVFTPGTTITLPHPEFPIEMDSVNNFDLVSSGKNLVNILDGTPVNCTAQYINNGVILTSTSTTGYLSIPIKLAKNQAYKMSFDSTRSGTTGGGYYSTTSGGTAITGSSSGLNGAYGNISGVNTNNYDIVYIRLYANAGGSVGDSATFTNVQLEAGSTETEYTPFRGISMVNFPYTLRGLTDGTKDYIEIDNVAKTTKLVRNIGELTLVGNESWGADTGGSVIYYFNATLGSLQLNISSWLCTHARYNSKEGYDYRSNLIFAESGSKYFEFSSWNFDTVNQFKSWLASQQTAGTPVKVQYKLATPIVTDLTYQELQVGYPLNNIYSTSSVKPRIIGQVTNK